MAPISSDSPLLHDEILKMLKGVDIGRGEKAQPTSVTMLDRKDGLSWVRVSLRGGKNREIRRLFEHFNKPVKRLIRTKFGPFSLSSITPGRWIELKEVPLEISKLMV